MRMEEMFFKFAEKGDNVLTFNQSRMLAQIYKKEQNKHIRGMIKPLNRLVRLEFSLAVAKTAK